MTAHLAGVPLEEFLPIVWTGGGLILAVRWALGSLRGSRQRR
jgi:hypothetical protein